MNLARLEIAGKCADTPILDGEIVELALLLPAGQAAALETAAWQRGLTTAQLARRIIRNFLDQPGEFRFPRWNERGISDASIQGQE